MAVSAQGLIVKRNGVAINELKDTTPPALTRKATDRTLLLDADDVYVMGIRHPGPMVFTLNWLPDTDDTQEGLLAAWASGSLDSYDIHFPDGAVWTFTGYVESLTPKDPVDGALEIVVTIQPSGGVNLLHVDSLLLMETGDLLLLETGDGILL